MRFTKKLIFIIALISFPYMNASAMLAVEETICTHLCKRITSRASYGTSKRFFGTIMDKSGKEILETAIIAKEKPPEYTLPRSFFMERRRGITLSNVNERIFHLHRQIKMEKELLIHEDKKNKQFALFKREGEKTIDRRVKVKEHLSPQYLPICYLHGSYKLSDEDSLSYVGSGFRNSLNQIVTAGHNLFIDEVDVKKYFESKKLPFSKFVFDKRFLTMQIIFGYRNEQGPKYSHISEVNGKHCFVHDSRDLGVIQLPITQRVLLDTTIGSLPTTFFPDQPHEYIDRIITLVGYPGEIEEPSLHLHSGPIRNVDPGKTVFYDIDTTKGNSGSPGLSGIEDGQNILPVFLTHTHAVDGYELNAGQGYDQDFYDFMLGHGREVLDTL